MDVLIVELQDGRAFITDASERDLIDSMVWEISSSGYVSGMMKGKHLQLHRLLLGLERGDKREGDHINLDKLDNRRSNLRIATRAQNAGNIGKRRNNKTGFIGVFAQPQTPGSNRKPWCTQARVPGRRVALGSYDTAEEAAQAYDRFVIANRGPFAFTNFPRDSYLKAA
jgi:hypothetical protein